MRNTFLFFIGILMIGNSVFAQKDLEQDIISTSIRYHYGKVLPHHKSISELVIDQISAVELNFGFIPSPKRNWAGVYKLPEVGIGIYRGNLGNHDVFGDITAVYPYVNFPIRRWDKWDFNTQLGFGVGYTENHFDPAGNNTNIAIGSDYNAFFKLMANVSYELAQTWMVNAGIGFNHASNGAVKVPNKGLNVLTGSLGVNYIWNGERPKNLVSSKNPAQPESEWLFIWNHGVKQISEIDQKQYYISSLSASYAFGINAKQKLGLGIDLFYDESANKGDDKQQQKTNFDDRVSQAIVFLHDLDIYRVSILSQIGIYTFYKTRPEKPFYFRVGVRYKINQRFLANLSLKAHMGRADFVEWGVGYRIVKKQ